MDLNYGTVRTRCLTRWSIAAAFAAKARRRLSYWKVRALNRNAPTSRAVSDRLS